MGKPDPQLNLFSMRESRSLYSVGVPESPSLDMTPDQLQQWKQAIARYQQDIRLSQTTHQNSLFEMEQVTANPDAIDPFLLKLHNFFFFEQPAHLYPDRPAFYFVIDTQLPLLLYVGETVKANQRWKGVHDCKRYVLNYRELHFKHGLETTINTAFYWDAPAATYTRQQLESALIRRWRSPFNKENWSFWGTPFVGGKLP